MRNGGLRHVEIPKDVGAEGLLELFFGQLFNRFLVLLESSIVYQNVEPSQFIDRLLHRITAEIRIAHVTRNQQALASFSFDGVAGLFRIALLFFQVDDGHISTLTRIENGYGPADAGISAGNQSNSVFELVCAFITGS